MSQGWARVEMPNQNLSNSAEEKTKYESDTFTGPTNVKIVHVQVLGYST